MLENKFINNTLLFIIAVILPVAFLAPLSSWIVFLLLSIAALLFHKKLSFINNLSLSEKLLFLFLISSLLSLIWTNNFKYGIYIFSSSIVLFFSLIINLHCIIPVNPNMLRKVLTVSYTAVTILLFVDLYFFLGIKPWLNIKFDYLVGDSNNNPGSYLSFLEDYSKGTFSGSYNRTLAIVNIFFFIIIFIHYKNKAFCFFLFLLTFFTLLRGESLSAFISFLFGLTIFILFTIFGRKTFFPVISFILIYALFFPFSFKSYDANKWKERHFYLKSQVFNLGTIKDNNYKALMVKSAKKARYKFEQKLLHRLMIWSVTSSKIKTSLLIGHGLGSSRKFGETESVAFIDIRDFSAGDSEKVDKKIMLPSIPLHPHNNILQIWLELGFIGIIILLSSIVTFWYALVFKSSLNRFQYSTISGSVVAVFVLNQASYGFWQAWWIAIIFFCIVLFNVFIKNAKLLKK